ncbi:DUF3131 domain-containing protein [Shimia sp. R11_0]|uniref:DUF3131 domain-containing protein n=1 Tax=Shimia sp. R11_0 TaxID=2821096 RepID=UPI001ADA6BB7|nr:DUF3131 domain-containing protein [Shimia sp. R11_0]MBO9478209.1 DUF3131 domain-containing protein [Shimia sp. R11_0]
MPVDRRFRDAPRRRNRVSVAFMIGVLATAGVAVGADDWGHVMRQTRLVAFPDSGQAAQMPVVQPARGLTAQDWQDARVAWAYFAAHYRAETGFVDAVSGYASATIWDQGSYLMALVAAQGLGLITSETFETRSAALLAGLERLPLFEGRLPNKAYDTRSLAMVDYENTPVPEGIGWSALDVARLLMALRALEMRAPQFGPRVRQLLASWDLAAMTAEGQLWGATRHAGETEYLQEGRIGYEQYGARAAALWGLDSLYASTARPILAWQEIQGVQVGTDRRRARSFGAITPVASDPYLMQAFEMGLTAEAAVLAGRLYQAQEARFRATRQLTSVSEDHIDQAPHFLYGTVFGNGRDWAVLSEAGAHYPQLRSISLKAAVGWDALYGSAYTQQLRAALRDLATPEGWLAGRYEVDGRINAALTLNTNAVVLEALHYKHRGPLLQ